MTGSAASVQTILTVASTALVTLTSVVLSLTLVAVQLAMGQFSPRIVRAILHDRRSQLAVGLFIGTFAYSMTVLREVNGQSSGGGPLPGLAIVVNYGLILSAIVVLVLYVNHTAQSIRVGGLIGWVADATRDEVDRLYPAAPEPEDDPSVVAAPDYGVVTKLPHHVLVDIAEKADCVLELVPAMGDFVPRGGPLFRVQGSLPEPHRSAAALSVILDRERSHEFEPAFGLRKLVDVAARSIYSSPFQDPTTSVQSINAIHDILRRLARREFPSGRHHDAHGHVRLVERVMSWEGYVRLAFDELRLAGAGSPQVARRLRAALEDLKTVASPERRPPLDRQLKLLDEAVRRAYDDDADVDAALVPDMQGIGSGPDVMSHPPRSASPPARDIRRPLADTAGARHGWPLGHRLHVQPAVTQLDPHALAGLDLAGQQPFRELVLQQPLDGSPERARPVLWVEAGVRQVLDRLVRHLQLHTLGMHSPRDPVEQQPRDLHQLLSVERAEHDDLVDPVEQLGPEALPQQVHQLVLQLLERLVAPRVRLDAVGPQVRGHDHDRVPEVDRAALAVREASVLEQLQQDVEDVGMRLLDLVQQQHRVRDAGARSR